MHGIEAVARQAGVSVSTVSRALRDVPGVSLETRERVRATAAKMGFVPSASGSRLATGRSGSVAIIVPTAATWFFGQVIAGAGSVIRAAAMDLLLFELGDPEGRRRFFAEQRLRGRADGVLVLSLNLSAEEADMLRRLDIPVICLGDVANGFGWVQVDNHSSAISAVRHLINLGHEHIGYIGIDDSANVTAGGRVLASRAAGYEEALRDAGLLLEPALRQFDKNTVDGGRKAMTRLMSAPIMPTAVFVGSDEMAFGSMDVLRAAGLSVPENVSIVGFDNHAFAELMRLSTIDQGARIQGESVGRALLAALEDPDAEPTNLILPTQLVLRGSTAPPSIWQNTAAIESKDG